MNTKPFSVSDHIDRDDYLDDPTLTEDQKEQILQARERRVYGPSVHQRPDDSEKKYMVKDKFHFQKFHTRGQAERYMAEKKHSLCAPELIVLN